MGGSLSVERTIRACQFVRILSTIIFLLGSLLASAATAETPTPATYDDVNTPEGWAWSQIKQGLPADFGVHCGAALDAKAQNDPWWRNDPCRTIQASFIVDLLTKSSLHDTIPYKGIVLINAKIVGDVDLEFTTIDRPLAIQFSRFEGAMRLDYAHADSLVDFYNSLFLGLFSAIAFRSETNVDLTLATIFEKIHLDGAKIKGDLVMAGANVKDDLEAPEIEVGGSLLMHSEHANKAARANKATFKKVNLWNATVAGVVSMVGASLNGDLEAPALRVGADLLMSSAGENKATFQNIILVGAEVANNVELMGASVAGGLMAGSLKVGGSLKMPSQDASEHASEATFKTIILVGAKVTRNVELNGARFDGDLIAESVQVGGSLIASPIAPYRTRFKKLNLGLSTVSGQVNMPNSVFDDNVNLKHLHVIGDVLLSNVESKGRFDISSAQIGGDLDFSDAKLDKVDLGGASIVGEIRLGNENSKVTWIAPTKGELNLSSTHVGRLSDNKESWPKRLFLEGFSFDHFGEKDGPSGAEMIQRGADWWNANFVELDPQRSRSPYEQLAAVFAAAGDHDDADKIHYDERVWVDQKNSGLDFVWSSASRWVVGYGIGTYMFRALKCVIGLSVLGAVLLRFWANKGVLAEKHSFIWCLGASVNRLLPVLNLKKEFVEFFDTRALNQFKPCQDFFFVVFAIFGWVLSFIVIAAFATVTHGP
jgi:hypothetical protein